MKKKVLMTIGLSFLIGYYGQVSNADTGLDSTESKVENTLKSDTSDQPLNTSGEKNSVENREEVSISGVVGTSFNFSGWSPISTSVTNNFTLSGTSYSSSSGLTAPLFANSITNSSSGISHTYSFYLGGGDTSRLFLYNAGVSTRVRSYSNYYSKTDIDGQKLLAGTTEIAGLEIVEVLKVTTDGKLLHTLHVTKVDTSTNTDNVYLVVGLDTMLDYDDRIPIISDGNNGSYITNDDITLWSEPLNGVSQYVGNYRDNYSIPLYSSATGGISGNVLLSGLDTAIAYLTTTNNYSNIGDEQVFSWQERLYTDGVNPFENVTIDFETNGGSSLGSIGFPVGSIPTKPADPTRPGYTFDGWYTDNTFTTQFDFSLPVNVDTTVYAKWKLNEVTISYESNGGSLVGAETFVPGTVPTKPANPTRPGFIFDGWYTDSSLLTQFDFSQSVNVDTVVYAKWRKLSSSGGSTNTSNTNPSTTITENKTNSTCSDDNSKDSTKVEVKEKSGQSVVKQTGSTYLNNLVVLSMLVVVSIAGTVFYTVKIENKEA